MLFYQKEPSCSSRADGTGLGMAGLGSSALNLPLEDDGDGQAADWNGACSSVALPVPELPTDSEEEEGGSGGGGGTQPRVTRAARAARAAAGDGTDDDDDDEMEHEDDEEEEEESLVLWQPRGRRAAFTAAAAAMGQPSGTHATGAKPARSAAVVASVDSRSSRQPGPRAPGPRAPGPAMPVLRLLPFTPPLSCVWWRGVTAAGKQRARPRGGLGRTQLAPSKSNRASTSRSGGQAAGATRAPTGPRALNGRTQASRLPSLRESRSAGRASSLPRDADDGDDDGDDDGLDGDEDLPSTAADALSTVTDTHRAIDRRPAALKPFGESTGAWEEIDKDTDH